MRAFPGTQGSRLSRDEIININTEYTNNQEKPVVLLCLDLPLGNAPGGGLFARHETRRCPDAPQCRDR